MWERYVMRHFLHPNLVFRPLTRGRAPHYRHRQNKKLLARYAHPGDHIGQTTELEKLGPILFCFIIFVNVHKNHDTAPLRITHGFITYTT